MMLEFDASNKLHWSMKKMPIFLQEYTGGLHILDFMKNETATSTNTKLCVLPLGLGHMGFPSFLVFTIQRNCPQIATEPAQ